MKKNIEKTNKSKRIGQKMKELREKKGFSLQQVSNELKKFNTSVSAATLQRYEIGEISRIPLDRVSELSKIYNTTPEYLMDWENNKNFISEQNVNNNNPDILTFYRADVKGLTEDEKEELKKDLEKYTDFLLQKIKEKNKK